MPLKMFQRGLSSQAAVQVQPNNDQVNNITEVWKFKQSKQNIIISCLVTVSLLLFSFHYISFYYQINLLKELTLAKLYLKYKCQERDSLDKWKNAFHFIVVIGMESTNDFGTTLQKAPDEGSFAPLVFWEFFDNLNSHFTIIWLRFNRNGLHWQCFISGAGLLHSSHLDCF